MKKFNFNVIALAGLVTAGIMAGALSQPANALPEGGRVIGGLVLAYGKSNNLTVWQPTRKGVIDWDSFSVAAGETVTFHVRKGGATLNRVIGNAESKIDGSIVSNGEVYLVNANGVVVSATSQIGTVKFTPTTKEINTKAFLSKNFVYQTDIQVPLIDIVPYNANAPKDRGVIGNLFSQN